jgi:hypothetical protein
MYRIKSITTQSYLLFNIFCIWYQNLRTTLYCMRAPCLPTKWWTILTTFRSETWWEWLLGVRIKLDADVRSDHYIVVAEIQLKIAAIKNWMILNPRLNNSLNVKQRNRFGILSNAADQNDPINVNADVRWNQWKGFRVQRRDETRDEIQKRRR